VFAIHYRWRLKPGTDETFCAAWRTMTEAIRASHGSNGSRLHRTDDGEYVAYAVWPSREAWQAALGQAPSDPAAAAAMRDCIDESYGALPLEVVDDRIA
jgi:heme-degrading monooxygenase HmoA